MADGTLIFDTNLDTSGLSAGLGKIGNVAGTAFKGAAVAVGAAATAVGALTKSSLDGYAAYEQLTGGVETLFKNSSGAVMQYADNAYKTAGMSANAYMETVTSFSASLIQSLGGDTAEAAKVADMAVTDMSDNANKMGTNIGMIQNAYQGFAKQNYTMLDNLKLGYGGTKEEMERLLADAEKISGIKYDISSFSDVANAIHVIQEEMGIAGTTALEAASTIEGSVGMMKAAWQNLVVGIADENADLEGLIDQFVDSVATAAGNIIPRIETILSGIGQLIKTMLPVIVNMVPGIINNVLPQLVSAGVAMINSIITGVTENLSAIIDLALDIVTQLVDVITSNLPLLIEAGLQVIVQLALGIASALPTLIPTIVNTVLTIVETIIDNIDMLVEAAIAIITALAQGIVDALPMLIEKAPVIISNLVSAIAENLPLILEAGLQIILTLAQALVTNIPILISKVPQIITSLYNSFISYMTRMMEVGRKIVSSIRDAISSAWSTVTGAVSGWVSSLRDRFISAVSSFVSVGSNIVNGIWSGIQSGWSWLTSKVRELAQSLLESAKDALGIQSPSKKFAWVGEMCVEGLWKSLQSGWKWLTSKFSGLTKGLLNTAKKIFGISSPSKEFALIGEMCVAGFDGGFKDLTNGGAIARGVNASLDTVKANTSVAFGGRATARDINQVININKEISTPDELARIFRLESKYGLMKGVSFA